MSFRGYVYPVVKLIRKLLCLFSLCTHIYIFSVKIPADDEHNSLLALELFFFKFLAHPVYKM